MRVTEYDDDTRESWLEWQAECRQARYICPDCGGGWDRHAQNCPNQENDDEL
jgi:hypothetical protein